MELDLHCHTRASFDSSMDPVRVLERARQMGLDAIAITDHDTTAGALESLEIARTRGDILVIIGEEIDTRAGDIIGLFLKEEIRTEDPLDAIRAIHDQGGIALLPHPFAKTHSLEERVAQELDACEGFNARHARIPSVDGLRGEERIVRFAQRYDLTLTASSDAHFYREIGRARTIVPGSTLDDAREALRAGTTVLAGRRSHPFNRLATAAMRTLARLARPERE